MIRRSVLQSAFALAVTMLLSAAAHAQLFRAYVASTGSDANPCTLPAPCRLLPAALSAVANGGEIWMLDSGNFNTTQVNVTKSVTILAVPGALGSVVAAGGAAINIATAGVRVALRNLVIVPLPGGGGTHGIRMSDGDSLTVEHCLIANAPAHGIFVDNSTKLRVTETTVRGAGQAGIQVSNGARATVVRATLAGNFYEGVTASGSLAGSTTTVDVADSTLDGNEWGATANSLNATATVKLSVRGSRVLRNTAIGVSAYSNSGGEARVSVSDNILSNNNAAIQASGAGTRVLVSANAITENTTGIANLSGLIETTGDNALRNNTTNKQGTIAVITLE